MAGNSAGSMALGDNSTRSSTSSFGSSGLSDNMSHMGLGENSRSLGSFGDSLSSFGGSNFGGSFPNASGVKLEDSNSAQNSPFSMDMDCFPRPNSDVKFGSGSSAQNDGGSLSRLVDIVTARCAC